MLIVNYKLLIASPRSLRLQFEIFLQNTVGELLGIDGNAVDAVLLKGVGYELLLVDHILCKCALYAA